MLGETVPVVENRALGDVIAVIRGHTGFGTARQQPQPVGEEHGSAVAAGR
ncbi:hypothetical protein [Streptomyces griseoaurantiacus]|uniref:Uncharacterized protein n=1 Tax=Streptomyces griseoaurantiacus TaxID=68213 RepID=A0A7W2DSV1_9ACTN|nr:hypothetical protein [Streptomyces griseoaurantiacus]MBA5222380.1 hypothetical protein [Streptomyces griseoaurantiacus]